MSLTENNTEKGVIDKNENGEVVVSVKNISKKFCRHLRRSMKYGIFDLSKNLVGIKPDSSSLRRDEFWAVKDINFELRKGQVLGLIGLNGSGKTTLLRLLAGIFPPDEGEITIKGRVGALIAVGAGFHPHMTGRENIYLNGTILGMTRKELDSKFDDIVEFAEVGEFLDAPVSTYSSGMRVKLGFAIAVHIDPDVLIIDEVLSVGDIAFKSKCFNAINKLMKDTAVIFVSHNLPQVSRICTDIIVMDEGMAEYQGGDVCAGIEYYQSKGKFAEALISGSGRAQILDIKIDSKNCKLDSKSVPLVKYLDDLLIDVIYSMDSDIEEATVGVAFLTADTMAVAQCISSNCNFKVKNQKKVSKLRLTIPKIQLVTGTYTINLGILDENRGEVFVSHWNAKEFRIVGTPVNIAPFQLQGDWEYIENNTLT